MSKRSERSSSSSSSSTSKPSPKRNRQNSEEMEEAQETDSPTAMKILLDKLNIIESRIEDNFGNLHPRIAQLSCEFKQRKSLGFKITVKELEKHLTNAWATIEDLQQETKTFRDSKGSHQQMLDEQTAEIERLKTHQLSKLKAENDHLTPGRL